MMADVLTSAAGRVGRIRLNRPKAIHALNYEMCQDMVEALTAWAKDDAILAVIIDHAEGRGFCAGGDIRMIAESGAGDGSGARAFFRLEYQLNHQLFTYEKPIIAFMDGITMGGGVGISQPAHHRVATDNTKFAMPETSIGLFPDVGGGWYLSRLPGRMGEYLALTGHRLNGAECLALGLATHLIDVEQIDAVKTAVEENPAAIEVALARAAKQDENAAILNHQEAIDRLFAGEKLEDIIAALEADSGDWAQSQLSILRTKSPQSMKVSLRLVREARARTSFADEMKQEFAIGARVAMLPDFIEGVRALIIDKDHAPRWQPATPEGVSDAAIDAIFAPLSSNEEWKPL